MSEANREYFQRRESEERAAAQSAQCPEAASIHVSLAERYAALAGDPQILTSAMSGQPATAEPPAAFAAR